ncbi:hypothetical protein HanXRQr2_Chr12g0562971 [Helianthus annuus]|uniref:Uncharacterized protein n=1 Tax=Helianthus annuus TaxID=4232 RepID=A0A9K3HJV6_HELAN|nr:hypothetical protein HanXRQr2_Chr12g0562971 [Helianthus annuus]KAJ0864477.1 hypothetical protein HanPSC8_Chr12g0542401 [Helianthus annuus]
MICKKIHIVGVKKIHIVGYNIKKVHKEESKLSKWSMKFGHICHFCSKLKHLNCQIPYKWFEIFQMKKPDYDPDS